MTVEETLGEAEHRMKAAVSVTQEELSSIRTGRANPKLVERLDVEYYGQRLQLNQLASFSVPEPRLLVLQPFDKTSIAAIERAIQASDLGLNPSNDGRVIRLAFPPLTQERRKELTKVAKERAEEGRVAVRNVRRHSKDSVERLEREHSISEDDRKRAEGRLQKLTDQYVAEIDRVLDHKEKELLEV
jgi:ribosome recycling factor